MKTKYELLDNNYLNVINDLLHFFVYNEDIKSVIFKEKSLIDLYALEIVISLLLKVIKSQSDIFTKNTTFALQVQQLFNYLWSHFKNIDNFLQTTTFHIKTVSAILLSSFKVFIRIYFPFFFFFIGFLLSFELVLPFAFATRKGGLLSVGTVINCFKF